MGRLNLGSRLTALAVVTLVGAGAYAFESQRVTPDAEASSPANAVPGASGAGAAPGSGQEPTRMNRVGLTTTAGMAAAATCPQGEYQLIVERYLRKIGGFGPVIVDGKQSATDCAAIKKFQTRFGIVPAAGRAGPTTVDVARRVGNTTTGSCGTGSGLAFCLNLTLQTIYVKRDGKVIVRPTVLRSGMPGFRTPAGSFRVRQRALREWSDPYKVWMPYWQRFYGGMGLHQTTTYIHNKAIGSHGCVNLLPVDARTLWNLGRIGTRVLIYGKRPGT